MFFPGMPSAPEVMTSFRRRTTKERSIPIASKSTKERGGEEEGGGAYLSCLLGNSVFMCTYEVRSGV